MILIASVRSSSIQHDVHLLNYGLIYSKIDNKTGSALGWGYHATDKHNHSVSSGSQSDPISILANSTLSSKYSHCKHVSPISPANSGWLAGRGSPSSFRVAFLACFTSMFTTPLHHLAANPASPCTDCVKRSFWSIFICSQHQKCDVSRL